VTDETTMADPFNLEALRATPDLETVNVEKVLTTVLSVDQGRTTSFESTLTKIM
jgi:hypothetical protein